MTAFAAITLDDGADTPVEHTFSPSGIDPQGVARLYENTDDVAFDARPALSLQCKLPRNGSPVARITAKVVVPVMDTEDPTLKKGEMVATAEFILPKLVNQAQRSDILAYLANFLAEASVVAAVKDLESIY